MPLTDAGFQPRAQIEILTALAASLGGALGIVVPIEDQNDPLTRLCSALSTEIASLELEVAGAYTAWSPGSAQGAQLDRVLGAFGTVRRAASSATVRVRVLGTPTLDVSGLLAQDPDGDLWVLPAGSVVDALGSVTVVASALDGGVKTPTLGVWTLTGTPPAGFTSITALEQVTLGSEVESDPLARERLAELLSSGRATEAALYAALYAVSGVDVASLRIYNNRSNVTSPEGVPARHVEAVVLGGTDVEIANALLAWGSAIQGFFGSTTATGSFTTPNGTVVSEPVNFTRPTTLRAYARATIVNTGAPTSYPTDGDETVGAAIAAYSEALRVGDDLLASGAGSRIYMELPAQSAISIAVEFSTTPSGPWNAQLDPGDRAFGRVSDQPSGAEFVGTNVEPFAISAGWQLDLDIGGGTLSTVFPALPAATAQNVADEINAAISGVEASDEGGALRLVTTATGALVSLEILGSSTAALLAALGLTTGTTNGRDTDVVSVTVL